MTDNQDPLKTLDEKNVNEKFMTVDQLADNQRLISCYQMQVDDNNNCRPVYLGKYPDVPLPVNKILKYNNHSLLVVTYVLTEEEIKQGLFKIVGVNVFKQNNKNSTFSLDLIMNDKNKNYQIIFNDHDKKTTDVVENIEKFPDRDKVIEYIIRKSFEEPVISRLIK